MSQSKTKTCQNCKDKFVVEPEDFEFYKKIGAPAPTFCPECRAQRRFTYWNLLELYKRKCDFSDKEVISIYRQDSPYKVYDSKIWWSDKWDAMDYGQEYDFNKPFFEQFKELKMTVPRPHNLNINSVNCDYCAATINSKNCYLCSCNACEDCAYTIAGKSKNCFDNFWVIKGENCYENLFCIKNYNLFFSQFSDNCIDSAFLYDCRNCQSCFGCVNLRNKKYHIFNKPYTKDEYQKQIKKYYLGKYSDLLKIKKKFDEFKLKSPRRYARIYHSHNVVGDSIRNTNNCYYCFGTDMGLEDCRYIYSGGNNLKDSCDIFDAGTTAELLYESVSTGINARRVYFSVKAIESVYDIQYSDHCFSSSNLFGCIGLRHKKYCILNKQYTKKEYQELVPKIKEHMNKMSYVDKKGRVYKYGEFFPIELSPFDYNKSVAQEHFPLTKEEVLEQGYSWYQKPESAHKPTIKAKDLPDDIKDVDKSILKEVIECGNGSPTPTGSRTPKNKSSNCEGTGVFRIIPQELAFYKKHKLSLPRVCPECRMWARLKQRNPMKLWKRKCMKKGCNIEFQTTYSPDRKEIVYCEKCYQEEVG